MSTIGDLFGDQLQQALADSDEGGDHVSDRESAVMETLAELAGVPVEDVAPNTKLQTDLGLEGLALWAVAAQVERDCGVQILDHHVQNWFTVQDVVDSTVT